MADPVAAAESFLRRFHARDPGCTSRAFERGRIAGVGSSYQLVAAAVPAGGRVLDLGCGDGALLAHLLARGHVGDALIGVDLSEAELAAARRRVPSVSLVQARAQALPLADASVAAVVSHLVMMLIPQLDAVIAELARVLAPGGTLAVVLGGGPGLGDAFERFADLLGEVEGPVPALTDPRLRSHAGISTLFGARFSEVVQVDHDVDLSGSFDEVWSSLSTFYGVPEHVDPLRARFAAACPPDDGGVVRCTMHVRLVTARR